MVRLITAAQLAQFQLEHKRYGAKVAQLRADLQNAPVMSHEALLNHHDDRGAMTRELDVAMMQLQIFGDAIANYKIADKPKPNGTVQIGSLVKIATRLTTRNGRMAKRVTKTYIVGGYMSTNPQAEPFPVLAYDSQLLWGMFGNRCEHYEPRTIQTGAGTLSIELLRTWVPKESGGAVTALAIAA